MSTNNIFDFSDMTDRLKNLAQLLQLSVKGCEVEYLESDIVIKGTPVVYQDVRRVLDQNRVPFKINRHPQFNTIDEIKIYGIDLMGPKLVYKENKSEVLKIRVIDSRKKKLPETKKIALKNTRSTEKSTTKRVIPSSLAECRNLEEELYFVRTHLIERSFTENTRLKTQWLSKDRGIVHLRLPHEFVEELLCILHWLGYTDSSLENRGESQLYTTIDLYLNHGEVKKEDAIKKTRHHKVDKKSFELMVLELTKTEILMNQLFARGKSPVDRFLYEYRKIRGKKPQRRENNLYKTLDEGELEIVKHAKVDTIISVLLTRSPSLINSLLVKERLERIAAKASPP